MVKTTWGGARQGAGRRRRGVAQRRREFSSTGHVRRPKLTRRGAALITVKVRPHVWRLRSRRCFKVIFKALVVAKGLGWIRVIDYSVLSNHIHLIVDVIRERRAVDAGKQLARGMQSLLIRIARGLNRLMGMKGKVFTERYDARPIRDDYAARKGRAYVVNNARHHFPSKGGDRTWIDEYSSAIHFDGWNQPLSDSQQRAARELRQFVCSQIRRELPRLRVASRRGLVKLRLDEPEVCRPINFPLSAAFSDYAHMSFDETPGPRRAT